MIDETGALTVSAYGQSKVWSERAIAQLAGDGFARSTPPATAYGSRPACASTVEQSGRLP
jgi:hypothetical protein